MDKITALEIRQQVMNSEKPQRALGRVLDKIVEDFEKIQWKKNCERPKDGIVGEILIK